MFVHSSSNFHLCGAGLTLTFTDALFIHSLGQQQQQQQYSSSNTSNNNGGDTSTTTCDMFLCGNTRIRGRRIRPGRNISVSLCGDTILDLHNATTLTPGFRATFVLLKLCGDCRVYVPRNVIVNVRRCALCGDRDIDMDEHDDEENGGQQQRACITIISLSLCGDVRVSNEAPPE